MPIDPLTRQYVEAMAAECRAISQWLLIWTDQPTARVDGEPILDHVHGRLRRVTSSTFFRKAPERTVFRGPFLRRLAQWVRYMVTPTVYPKRWQDKVLRGHLRWKVGPIEIVLFGANAMHWALHVWLLGHWWCVHPTTHTFGGRWPWYFYLSKDATPQSACFILREEATD